MTTPTKSFWRVDITALRAIAVLPVLLFHAFPSLIPGGFVGVDVFFVISGYLISGILFREFRKTGKIDFWLFYQKRIRRILPNLFLLIFFVAVVGWLFFYELRTFVFSEKHRLHICVWRKHIFNKECSGLFRAFKRNESIASRLELGNRRTVLYCFSSFLPSALEDNREIHIKIISLGIDPHVCGISRILLVDVLEYEFKRSLILPSICAILGAWGWMLVGLL